MMTAKQQSFIKSLSLVLEGFQVLPSEYDVKVNNLVLDSRKVMQGDLFIAINGEEVNGIDYINAAVKAGAVAVLWDSPVDSIPYSWSSINKNVPVIAVVNLKEKLGELVSRFYNEPSRKLDIVGVTGTNGKTSCVNFIAQALADDKKCGLIGTLGTGIYPEIAKGTHTTPDVITVHKTLSDFVRQNASHSAIEVSSHALTQGRVDAVQFNTAIFTNLTQDHLDYHGTMDAYLNEKLKLFQLSELQKAIINSDDPGAGDVIAAAKGKKVITYSTKDSNTTADLFASNIQFNNDITKFVLNTQKGSVSVETYLVGDFNISNLLAVSAYLIEQGYSLELISQKIKSMKPVEGRMQKIETPGAATIIIDFAHTPDALEKVLKTLREKFSGKLTCVFGCGGERDKEKRSQMGSIAEEYADLIVLTNDNPRGESAEAIVSQIEQGIVNKENVIIELDRKKAIAKAIGNTATTGCVLIAGKGHENYQIIGHKKINFSDVDAAREVLRNKR